MAAFATGFVKFLAASTAGRNNAAHSARAMERRVNREYDIALIIKCERACCGGSGLEWLSLSYLLYSFVLAVGMLLSLPYWLYQILRHGKYRSGFFERMGKVPARLMTLAGSPAETQPNRSAGILPTVATATRPRTGPGPVIWVHAVSLGEVLAVSRLVHELRRTFPRHRVLVSTTTDTGQQL